MVGQEKKKRSLARQTSREATGLINAYCVVNQSPQAFRLLY